MTNAPAAPRVSRGSVDRRGNDRLGREAVWVRWRIRDFNTGGRYRSQYPTVGQVLAPRNAPAAPILHTAVWTGTEMIVWGGAYCPSGCSYFNTGGNTTPAPTVGHPRALLTRPWRGLSHSRMVRQQNDRLGRIRRRRQRYEHRRQIRSDQRQLGIHQHHQRPVWYETHTPQSGLAVK